MGSNSVFAKGKGKKRIQAAVGGLILGLVGWLILQTINPEILEVKVAQIDFKENTEVFVVFEYDQVIRDIGTDVEQNVSNTIE